MKRILRFALAVAFPVSVGLAETSPVPASPDRRGDLVLQFDDGWSQWLTEIAPELQRVGGRATGFVTWQYVESSRIRIADLRHLQDDYGWEIGVHGATHTSARRWAAANDVDSWVAEQLDLPLQRLHASGLDARSLAFPFNDFTPALAAAVRGRVECFRRPSVLALTDRCAAEGSFPGTTLDLVRYVPPALLRDWVDLAQARGQMLFLYGHRVLPDERFFNARVIATRGDTLELDRPVVLPDEDDLVLVPDTARRQTTDALRGFAVDGNTVRVPGVNVATLTKAGATCRIGAAYGWQKSEFISFLDYCAPRLNFLRMQDAVQRVRPAAPQP